MSDRKYIQFLKQLVQLLVQSKQQAALPQHAQYKLQPTRHVQRSLKRHQPHPKAGLPELTVHAKHACTQSQQSNHMCTTIRRGDSSRAGGPANADVVVALIATCAALTHMHSDHDSAFLDLISQCCEHEVGIIKQTGLALSTSSTTFLVGRHHLTTPHLSHTQSCDCRGHGGLAGTKRPPKPARPFWCTGACVCSRIGCSGLGPEQEGQQGEAALAPSFVCEDCLQLVEVLQAGGSSTRAWQAGRQAGQQAGRQTGQCE